VAGRYVCSLSWVYITHEAVYRDVTDHLQLLLRKSGHHLHTTAEREVVRTIKEKCCYIAANPAKEEKESLGRHEDFRLPDGQVIQVGQLLHYTHTHGADARSTSSSGQNDSVHQRSCSTRNSLARNTQEFIKLSSTLSIVWTWIYGRTFSPTSSSAVAAP
jgi:hypothetical protein